MTIPALPAGFDFPTCQQAVVFTGEYVPGRQALGRMVLGLPAIAVALLRALRGDTFLANRFWAFHEAGLQRLDWLVAHRALRAKNLRAPVQYVVRILEDRVEALSAA